MNSELNYSEISKSELPGPEQLIQVNLPKQTIIKGASILEVSLEWFYLCFVLSALCSYIKTVSSLKLYENEENPQVDPDPLDRTRRSQQSPSRQPKNIQVSNVVVKVMFQS